MVHVTPSKRQGKGRVNKKKYIYIKPLNHAPLADLLTCDILTLSLVSSHRGEGSGQVPRYGQQWRQFQQQEYEGRLLRGLCWPAAGAPNAGPPDMDSWRPVSTAHGQPLFMFYPQPRKIPWKIVTCKLHFHACLLSRLLCSSCDVCSLLPPYFTYVQKKKTLLSCSWSDTATYLTVAEPARTLSRKLYHVGGGGTVTGEVKENFLKC